MVKKILVMAPHPDDEVLGCGGTIAKNIERGNEVYLCVATEPYTPDWSETYIKRKREEIQASNNILGITDTHFLGYPTVKLDTISQKRINDDIATLVREINPSEVYIPHRGDINKDHGIIHDATLVATRPLNQNIENILAYETLSETEWGTIPFIPTVYEKLSNEHIQTKIQAMEAFASELKEYPHPRSTRSMLALSQKRGSEISSEYAEAFSLVRQIRK